MTSLVLLSLTAALTIAGLSPSATADATARTVQVPGMGEMHVSAPLMHKNLTVFVLHRANRPDGEIEYLTLDEATEKGLVKITEAEREQVQQLSITYTGTKPLFLAAGELVKGGKQDRTLQSSLVVPPKTKQAALPSFCVEASRWHGGKVFQSAKNVAANVSQQALQFEGQGRVWESVRQYKMQLRENAAKVAGTQPKASRTSSLNEELEAGEVKQLLSGYEKTIAKAGDGLACPLGLAYAVDGRVTAVHVFHSSSLFGKFKDKLLRSAAIDAAVGKIDKKPEKVTATDLQNFLAQAGDGAKKTMEPGFKNKVTRYLNDKTFTSLLAYRDDTVHAQVGRFQKFSGGGPMQLRQSRQQLNVLPNQEDQQQIPLQPQRAPRRNNDANEPRPR
jgi:hypothetical protein